MAYLGKTPSQAVRQRYYFTASGSETSLSGNDDGGNALSFTDGEYVDVKLNGVQLVSGTDYNTTTANTIGGLTALTASDVVEITVYDTFSLFGGEVKGDFNVTNGNIDVSGTLTADGVTAETSADPAEIKVRNTGNTSGFIIKDYSGAEAQLVNADNGPLVFKTNDTEAMRIDSSGNVVIGATSTSGDVAGLYVKAADPSSVYAGQLGVKGTATSGAANTGAAIAFEGHNGSGNRALGQIAVLKENATSGNNDSYMRFATRNASGSAERMRLDSEGQLLIGNTTADPQLLTSGKGIALRGNIGMICAARSGDTTMSLNRTSSYGDVLDFRRNGTLLGRIGHASTSYGNNMFISGEGGRGLSFDNDVHRIFPVSNNGARADGSADLGGTAARFNDVHATNGTIQTSDQNEKQQIASLTTAEITAAKAISKLFKTFKWNDSVTAKGDNARTHTGVIAQQVETAMSDAGLDAGDYAFFISETFTDEDGNSQTRKGIRYPELLSFVGAATEQRLADIETRLTALEAN